MENERKNCDRPGEVTGRPSPRPFARAETAPVPGDRLEMRKPHPCGANDWELLRLGVDAALRCHRCGRVVVLQREELLRRLKRVLPA